MKITIPVTFDVESQGADELTEAQAKDAAELAAFHHLSLVDACGQIVEQAEEFLDGFGHVVVRIDE